MGTTPAVLVAPPTRAPLPYGLFSVLTPRSGTRELNGIEWEAMTCSPAALYGGASCPPPVDQPAPALPDAAKLGAGSDFTVIGSYRCSPVGQSLEDMNAKALAHLVSREEQAVEQWLWDGYLGSGGLASEEATDVTQLSTTAPPASLAMAALEDWAGTVYGSLGVFHMTRGTAALLLAKDLLTSKGSGLYTALGHPVVAGSGYSGQRGDLTLADTEAMVYATPPYVGYRSEVFYAYDDAPGGFDHRNNSMLAQAFRSWALGHDPCPVGYARLTLPAF